jgi:hypothetical protein
LLSRQTLTAAKIWARAAVDPFLRCWEIEKDLAEHFGTIRFEFLSADVVDRDPPPVGTSQVVQPNTLEVLLVSDAAEAAIIRGTYPVPAGAFCYTTHVQEAYDRWRMFVEGREPLQSMSYFLLTRIEAIASGRKRAAKTFNIEYKVLNTLGYLSSDKSDGSQSRKAKGGDELTSDEKVWLQRAVPKIIIQLGIRASGGTLSALKMTDLPVLP